MAGSIFKVKDRIYCPSQISGYTYGQSVEIKEIRQTDNGWEMNTIRKLMPPKGILIDGLHTFNTYKGMIVVDIHKMNSILGVAAKNYVILKKRIIKYYKSIFKKQQ